MYYTYYRLFSVLAYVYVDTIKVRQYDIHLMQ